MRTGIRNIKGGRSKQEDIGRDCLLYFYWQGKDCTVADKGTAALMMSEIDSDEGPQVRGLFFPSRPKSSRELKDILFYNECTRQ